MTPSVLQSAHATRWLRALDAHIRFLAALAIGVLTVFLLPHTMLLQTRLVVGYDAGAVCLLAMAWTVMNFATPHAIHAGAWRQDTSRTVIFLVVLFAACAGLAAIFIMLGSVKAEGVPPGTKFAHVVVSVLAVLCSWLMTHTTFALHYARRYYQDVVKRAHTEEAGGLEFQERGQPDYWDFAYFSFTIGMTSQTSDVAVTTRPMRRLTLVHGVLSFFFNTAVLAMAINIVASVL